MAVEEQLTTCQFDVGVYSRGNPRIASHHLRNVNFQSSKFLSFYATNPTDDFVCFGIFNLFVFTNIKRKISIHQLQYCRWANYCAI